MNVVDYKPEHMFLVTPLEHHASTMPFATPEYARELAKSPAKTGFIDGQIVGIAGVVPVWEGRAFAWSYLDVTAALHMLALTRAVRSYLDTLPVNRIEMTVICGFEAGHRWAKMLGFELEAPIMREFHPGVDCSLYARVKP